MKATLITFVLTAAFFARADVDIAGSKFEWKASKITGSYHEGTVKLKSAILDIKKDRVAKGEFIMDMTSIDDSDLSGDTKTKLLNHIKSGDFFEVEKYPTAKFVIDSDNGKEWAGKMTIKDKTQPMKVAYKKEKDAFTGKFTFDRTKYGIVFNSANFFKNLGDKVIKDEVEVNFNVKLKSATAKKS